MTSPPPPANLDSLRVKDQLAQSHTALVAKVEAAAALVDAEYAFEALVPGQVLTMSEGFEEVKHGDIPALLKWRLFTFIRDLARAPNVIPARLKR